MNIPKFLKKNNPVPERHEPWVGQVLQNVEKELKPNPVAYGRPKTTEAMSENLNRIADDLRRMIIGAEALVVEYRSQHEELTAKIASDLEQIDELQGTLTRLRESLPPLPDGGEDEENHAGDDNDHAPDQQSSGGKDNLRPNGKSR